MKRGWMSKEAGKPASYIPQAQRNSTTAQVPSSNVSAQNYAAEFSRLRISTLRDYTGVERNFSPYTLIFSGDLKRVI